MFHLLQKEEKKSGEDRWGKIDREMMRFIQWWRREENLSPIHQHNVLEEILLKDFHSYYVHHRRSRLVFFLHLPRVRAPEGARGVIQNLSRVGSRGEAESREKNRREKVGNKRREMRLLPPLSFSQKLWNFTSSADECFIIYTRIHFDFPKRRRHGWRR